MTNKKNYRKFAVSTMAATAAVAAVAPAVSAAEQVYPDVPTTNSFHEAIMALTDQGVVQGYENGDFGVWDSVTRGQVAVMLTKALDLQTPENVAEVLDVYSDVNEDTLYANEIAAVTEEGIFNGDSGEFNPADDITREQMATVLYLGFDLDQYDDGEDVDAELGNVSPSHLDRVQTLLNLDISNQAGDFRPAEDVSRGQFSAMVYLSQNVVAENAAPEVESVSAITANTVEVELNQEDLELTAEDFSLVQTDDEFVQPKVTEVAVEGNVATLSLGDSLTDGKSYSLTVEGIEGSTDFAYDTAVASSVEVTTETISSSASTPKLTAEVYDIYGNDISEDYAVKWETNQPANAIDVDGNVTLANVSGTILAKAYVVNADDEKVYSSVQSITVDDAEATSFEGFTIDADGTVADFSALETDEIKTELKVNGSGFLFPMVNDQYGNQYGSDVTTDGLFTFSSSNPTVLVVDENTGELTPISEGTATVKIESGDFSQTITVDVKAAAVVSSIEVPETSLSISDQAPNKAIKVSVKDQYGDAVDGKIVTATVDEADGEDHLDATITGVTADGETTLSLDPKLKGTETVTLSIGSGDDKVETTITVNVVESGQTTGYAVMNSASDNELDVNKATDDDLSLTLYPVDANGNVSGAAVNATWTVEDYADGFVTIDNDAATADGVTDSAQSSVEVTGETEGTATLTATVGSLDVGTFDVVVTNSTPELASVSLDTANLTVQESTSDALTAVLANINGFNGDGEGFDLDNDGTYEPTGDDVLTDAQVKAIYSSDNTVIVGDTTVDGDSDELTISKAGTTTLTITFEDSSIDPVAVKVKVEDNVDPAAPLSEDLTVTATDINTASSSAEVGATWKVVADGAASTATAVDSGTVGASGAISGNAALTTETDYDVYVIDSAGNVSTKVDIATS